MMPSSATLPNGSDDGPRVRGFSLLFGTLLGLALLKFGNPVIMEQHVDWPGNGYEWLFNPWPVVVGYGLLAVVAIVALLMSWRGANKSQSREVREGGEAKRRQGFAAFPRVDRTRWLAAGPAAWLVWQVLVSAFTVDETLTVATLKHFITCVVCFYIGLFALGRVRHLGWFWLPIGAGLLLVMGAGFDQRFRGLEEMRGFIRDHERTQWTDLPPAQVERLVREGVVLRTPEGYIANPGLLKRLESSRISGTLFYPNTLAGAFLLLLPASLVAVLGTPRLTVPARGFVAAILAGGAGACLYWSGSKAGWLLMLGLLVVALLRLPLGRGVKVGIVCGLIIAGMAGFAWKYASFFQRGATSVVARSDYWRAALQTAAGKPFCGSGPGTFSRAYERIKKPESEMARLTHNDYLQQASDSGWPGFVLYAVFVGGVLVIAGRRAVLDTDWMRFAVWLGVLGWSAQNCVEFGLYIPALAWPGFALMGWLVANESQSREVREGNEGKPWQGFAACAAYTRHRPQNDSTTKPPPASVKAKK